MVVAVMVVVLMMVVAVMKRGSLDLFAFAWVAASGAVRMMWCAAHWFCLALVQHIKYIGTYTRAGAHARTHAHTHTMQTLMRVHIFFVCCLLYAAAVSVAADVDVVLTTTATTTTTSAAAVTAAAAAADAAAAVTVTARDEHKLLTFDRLHYCFCIWDFIQARAFLCMA